MRSDGPTRASSSIEIPAARPTPKKEFPRRGAGHPWRVHRSQNSGGSKDVYLVSPPLAWVSRRDTPTERGRRRGRKASGICGIFDTGGMDRARPVRSDAGATLTWHVGRYQVLPRHRVDAERRRMCDSRSPLTLAYPFRLTTRLPLVLRVLLSPYRFPPYARATLVSLRFCTRGDTPLCSIAPTCATLTLPPPSPHYHRCRRQQVDDVYRLGIATMQPIFHRNYHSPSLFYSFFVSLLRKRKRGGERKEGKEKEKVYTLIVTPGTRLRNVAP